MSDKQDTSLPHSSWQAATLRLTVFPSSAGKIRADEEWEQLTGVALEQSVRQRTETLVSGLVGEARLILIAEPIKFDWRLLPGDTNSSTLGTPTLGSFDQALGIFLPLMNRWLNKPEWDFNRIAFGAELIIPVADHSSGYRSLGSYLKDITIDDENSSDFLYQVNKPRKSQVDIADLKINRLMKWSVGKTAQVALLPSGQILQVAGMEQYYTRLELDINTGQDFSGNLPNKKLIDIFTELVQLGQEISENGDIR